MQYEVRKVDIFSAVKIGFVLSAASGFLFALGYALFFSFFVAVFSSVPGFEDIGGDAAIAGGAMLVILSPVVAAIFGVLGAIKIAILAWLYNMVAAGFGGVKVRLSSVEDSLG
jgi:hypothetical protein